MRRLTHLHRTHRPPPTARAARRRARFTGLAAQLDAVLMYMDGAVVPSTANPLFVSTVMTSACSLESTTASRTCSAEAPTLHHMDRAVAIDEDEDLGGEPGVVDALAAVLERRHLISLK